MIAKTVRISTNVKPRRDMTTSFDGSGRREDVKNPSARAIFLRWRCEQRAGRPV